MRSKSLWRESIALLTGMKHSSSAAPRLSFEEVLERNRIAMLGVVRTVDKDHSATFVPPPVSNSFLIPLVGYG
jgi:hypothetical protein